MKRASLVFLTLLFLASLPLVAQEQPSVQPATQAFGLAVGSTTGIGPSWRLWPGPWGLQVTALPLFAGDTHWVSMGANGLYTFHETTHTRFFGYTGLAALSTTTSRWAEAGFGFGLELFAWDHFAFDLEAGFGFDNRWNSGFRLQGGVFYKW